MKVYRLEFWQPDGRWTGPYCAEYMTEAAFAIRDRMVPHHKTSTYHVFPDAAIFAANPGPDRYVCGATSMKLLRDWFGEYFMPFLGEGGHVGIYEVPEAAVAENDGLQVVYQQRQARLLNRRGKVMPPQHLLIEHIHPDKLWANNW
jgi:hypothetical protein